MMSHPAEPVAVQLRRRRAAGRRLPPLSDGQADPLDNLSFVITKVTQRGQHDVAVLGLMPHARDRCRACQAVGR